jgi:phage/plasmid-like protein (TIGR03299 family)
MTTDVNAAFHAEKTTQIDTVRQRAQEFQARIDRGEIELIDRDRYRVLTGWDAGEIFAVQRDTEGQIEQIIAAHGLDLTATGDVALYSAVPAWHGLGQVIPGGVTDIDEVLRLGGIDWEVEKRHARYGWDGQVRVADEHFVTVRADTGDALGLVGGRYAVIQNRALFAFLEDLVNEHGVVWESAGALRGGRKVFVSMRVPESVTVDPGGLDDEITLFIVAINSHDGTSSAAAVVTPWRPVCGNTERFAVRDAVTRWGIRHTAGALSRLEEARRTLGLAVTYADAFTAEETALARTDLAVAEFHQVIDDLWPVDDDATDRTRTFADHRREHLDAMFRAETQRAGRTA